MHWDFILSLPFGWALKGNPDLHLSFPGLHSDSLCSAGRAGARIVGTMQGGDTEEDVSNQSRVLAELL